MTLWNGIYISTPCTPLCQVYGGNKEEISGDRGKCKREKLNESKWEGFNYYDACH